MKLSRDVSLNDDTKTINLPKGNIEFDANKKCTVTGFGRTSSGGRQSNLLLKALVPMMFDYRCPQLGYPLTFRMLCAGYESGRVNSCPGDNGGPLACEENRKYYLAGVVSAGRGRGSRDPVLYAKVKEFLSWLDEVMRQYP